MEDCGLQTPAQHSIEQEWTTVNSLSPCCSNRRKNGQKDQHLQHSSDNINTAVELPSRRFLSIPGYQNIGAMMIIQKLGGSPP